jgi:nitroreductase
MNVIEALQGRHAVRDFKPEPIAKETILKIVEAATRSPSTSNTQCWEIYLIGGDVLERIRHAYMDRYKQDIPGNPELPGLPPDKLPAALAQRKNQMRTERLKLCGFDPNDPKSMKSLLAPNYKFFGAPMLVILCMDHMLGEWQIFDLGLLSQSIMLAAQEFGLDSIPASSITRYPDILRKELAIPDNLIITIGIALGYGNTKNIVNTYRSSRRPINEVVTFKGI